MKNVVLSLLLLGTYIMGGAQVVQSPYQSIVSIDGSGHFRTIQAAINAVPDGQTKPWLILLKNGSYKEQVVIPESKPYIHLIGQDREKTIIHLNLNVGGRMAGHESEGKVAYWQTSIHNPTSPVYKYEGAVMLVKGNHFYAENISFINDWGVEAENGPQALAMSSQADCVSLKNCKFRSFQDTWMTAHDDLNRHYVKDCWIEGAVDYLYGGGNILLENCVLYSLRSGAVIVAPSHKNAKYGYVFRDCIISGNSKAADGRLKLGRPWHNSPKAMYINTTMLIPIAAEGWSDMGAIPESFSEFNSHDIQGNVLDLSKRKTIYQYRDRNTGEKIYGECQATITKVEADKYTYENMIPGNDNWNPRTIMEELKAPHDLVYQQGTLTWEPVKNAIGYIVYDGEQIIGTTTKTIFSVLKVNYALKVSAVNQYGSQGKKGIL